LKRSRVKIKTPFNALDHSLDDGDLYHSVGACALGVDDDPGFVVDEVVCVVSRSVPFLATHAPPADRSGRTVAFGLRTFSDV
jgi:hypothetical protein